MQWPRKKSTSWNGIWYLSKWMLADIQRNLKLKRLYKRYSIYWKYCTFLHIGIQTTLCKYLMATTLSNIYWCSVRLQNIRWKLPYLLWEFILRTCCLNKGFGVQHTREPCSLSSMCFLTYIFFPRRLYIEARKNRLNQLTFYTGGVHKRYNESVVKLTSVKL